MKRYVPVIALLLLTACTTKMYDLHPKSHYSYPNSNIKPLGEATGEASQVTFFVPPLLSGEVARLAVESALRTKPGSDILLNYTSETKVTALAILPIYILSYKVRGTAASMSVGMQELR